LLHARADVGHLHYFTEGTVLATLHDFGYRIEDYFFTALSIELKGGGLKRRLARLPRRLLATFSCSFASKMLGGFPLLVLAQSGWEAPTGSAEGFGLAGANGGVTPEN